jgi:hypothetical protein
MGMEIWPWISQDMEDTRLGGWKLGRKAAAQLPARLRGPRVGVKESKQIQGLCVVRAHSINLIHIFLLKVDQKVGK